MRDRGRLASARTPLPEALLARLWAAQAFAPRPLRTLDGTPVQVLFPGRPAAGAGPDFRDAIIRLGDGPPLTGDVELHRHARDFARHGHGDDPAYGRLLLHVVFHGADEPTTALAGGRRVPVVVLTPDEPPGLPWRAPCATASERLGTTAVRALLAEAGLWRLAGKTAALRTQIERDGAAAALYRALAVALGQKANAAPFAALTERLPLAAALAPGDEEPRAPRLRARLLHAAGLDGALLAPGPALPWATAGRPAAHPARRIAALAVLLDRLARPDLVSGARALVERARREGARVLLQSLIVADEQGPALCGRARAVEVAINALLPWAAALAEVDGDPADGHAVLQLAAGLPAGEPYGAIAHLARDLRDGRGRSLLRSALEQQGALALAQAWCTRGGCGRCPLSPSLHAQLAADELTDLQGRPLPLQ
jgi:hypothetical protein